MTATTNTWTSRFCDYRIPTPVNQQRHGVCNYKTCTCKCHQPPTSADRKFENENWGRPV